MPRRHSYLPSFLMGLALLILSLLQGGPGPALSAIGRATGIVKSPLSPVFLGQPAGLASPTAVPPIPIFQPTPTPTTGDELAYSPTTTWEFPANPRLVAMRDIISRTLQERELVFAGRSGQVTTFFPGDVYAKLWARDLATMLPAVQYFYDAPWLRSGVEELLAHQYDDATRSDDGDNGVAIGAGALPGIISSDGRVNKDTITSDEETSVVHAAYIYYRAHGGADWLRTPIMGTPVISRLTSAMDWLYSHRFDPKYRLIKRGHTTDWGDVKYELSLAPTDYDPRTDHWTASIYDQAMTFRALRELAEMYMTLGNTGMAQSLVARAEDLRQATNRALWMPDKGYFRLHMHITPLKHSFDEDAMVAIGNVMAVSCGLATPEQQRSIVAALEQARVAAGSRKPGVSLYPSYPTGFFATVQRNRGEYQNGGVWDWWGGIQIAAEFDAGYSTLALGHLYQVAADWEAQKGVVWEWNAPGATQGRGARGYASAAATVAEAIIQGLYGVMIQRDGIRLEPRLGSHAGYIRAYHAALDTYMAYRYVPGRDSLTIHYGTNSKGEIPVRLLLPAGRGAQEVRIDEGLITAYQQTVGNDRYVIFTVPAGRHTVVVQLAISTSAQPATIDPAFLDYYMANNGSYLLGQPVTPAFFDGTRRIQFFEKGKLEDHSAETSDPVWRFSYGLIVEELVRMGPNLPVGGERSTVTYTTLREQAAEGKRTPPPAGFRSGVVLNKDGSVFIPFSATLQAAPGHIVAPIFWIVLTSDRRSPQGWLHDVGLPLTPAITATVDKGPAKGRRVLIQAFQRAIFVYDGQNPPGQQVEKWTAGRDYLAVFPERAGP